MNPSLPTPLKAQIVVQYRRDVPERYDVLISPISAGEVCVRLRSPVVGETVCRLNRWPGDGSDSMATRAIRAIVGCFFGGPHPAPRIVGSPDWVKVTCDVSAVTDDRKRRLLLLELTCDTPQHGTFMRSSGTRVLRDEAVRLCPEDADAIYAVTRLALSSKGAHVEREPAPVRAMPALAAAA